MKQIICYLLFILSSAALLSQSQNVTDSQINSSAAAKIMFVTNVTEAQSSAKKDIENNTPFLFTSGGIAPIIYSTDKEFERKYSVYFYDIGCIAPDEEIMIEYNKIVFDLLDSKFGKNWRREIRLDILGFKEFRKIKPRR